MGIPILDSVDAYTRKFNTCERKKYKIDLKMTEFDKNNIPKNAIQQEFNGHLEKIPEFIKIYTDGSKKSNRVGAAFTSDNVNESFKLPQCCSIFTAELFALWKAVNYGEKTRSTNIMIWSDSLSAINALTSEEHPHPLIARIQDKIYATTKRYRFLWLPSHCGIKGNEKADKLANDEINSPQT